MLNLFRKIRLTLRLWNTHWASVGEHDAKRKEPPPVERLFDILNSIFLLLESNPAIEEAWLSRGGRGDRRRREARLR